MPAKPVVLLLAVAALLALSLTPLRYPAAAPFGRYIPSVAAQGSPVVAFSAAAFTVNEHAGSVVVTLSRTGNLSGETTVTLATAFIPGSADASDFSPVTNGTITFTPAGAVQVIVIPITNDNLVEPAEQFSVSIISVTGGTAGNPDAAMVTIVSEDTPATGSVSGTITLQGRTEDSPGNLPHYREGFQLAQIVVHVNGTQVFSGFVGEDGSFSVNDLPTTQVDLFASAPGYLGAQKLNVAVSPGSNDAGSVQLRAGRVNADELVSIVDIVAIIAAFGSTTEDRTDGTGRVVDINGDRVVNLHDLTLTLSNFNRQEPQPWP